MTLDFYGPDFDYEKYNIECHRNFREKYDNGKLPLKPGVKELLKRLKKEEIKTAIASSTRTIVVISEIRDAGLLGFFDEIVGGDMVTRSKPDPEIFKKAAKLLNVEPGNCCVIEDSYNGVLAAYAAGMFPIMVPDMLFPNHEIAKKAGLILNSLNELNEMIRKR